VTLQAFFTANPLPSSQRRISQSIEMIRSAASLLEKIKASPLATAQYWK
jgi:hypothetical protein